MKRRLREVETLIDTYTSRRDGEDNPPPYTLHTSDHQVDNNTGDREVGDKQVVRDPSPVPDTGSYNQDENMNDPFMVELSGVGLLQKTKVQLYDLRDYKTESGSDLIPDICECPERAQAT
ncbi:unnamed protein product [Blumeria hordei]|uniref:Uncharacterized protein n=1 Tax=Blumeria hordei TaxID=2867405 RepID=A0A383UWD0_BLUHO|nr:unnamed protein product [Blumeria hordei]